jgi:hypothetical protein
VSVGVVPAVIDGTIAINRVMHNTLWFQGISTSICCRRGWDALRVHVLLLRPALRTLRSIVWLDVAEVSPASAFRRRRLEIPPVRRHLEPWIGLDRWVRSSRWRGRRRGGVRRQISSSSPGDWCASGLRTAIVAAICAIGGVALGGTAGFRAFTKSWRADARSLSVRARWLWISGSDGAVHADRPSRPSDRRGFRPRNACRCARS